MRLLVPALAALAVLPALAEEAPAFREAARAWLHGDPYAAGADDAVRKRLPGAADAARIWIEELSSAGLEESAEWYFANRTPALFGDRSAELKPPVRDLLAGSAENGARLGARLAIALHADVEMADLLVPLIERDDSSSDVACQAFQQCRDDAVARRLLAIADRPGRVGERAVSALGRCDAPAAQPLLRRLAEDPKEREMKRRWAIEGLGPLTDPADLAILRRLVEGERGEILHAAVMCLEFNGRTLDLETLRAARPRYPEYALSTLNRLLCAAGDPDALEAVLKRAQEGQDWPGAEIEWVLRSPLPRRVTGLQEALDAAKDVSRRRLLVEALGKAGDMSSFDRLLALRVGGDDREAAESALAVLVAGNPAQMRAALARILEKDLKDDCLLRTFQQRLKALDAKGCSNFDLEAADMSLLRAHIHDKTARHAVWAALRECSQQDFRDSDLAAWEAWWQVESARHRTD